MLKVPMFEEAEHRLYTMSIQGVQYSRRSIVAHHVSAASDTGSRYRRTRGVATANLVTLRPDDLPKIKKVAVMKSRPMQ